MSRRKELYFAIAVGAAAEALKDIRLKMGEGIAGWVAKHGEQVILSDVDQRSQVCQTNRRSHALRDAIP